MKKPELLPCTWCRSTEVPHLYEEPLEDGAHCKRWSLMCPECHARGPEYIAPSPDRERLVSSWNRRTPIWTRIEDCPEEWKDGRTIIACGVNGLSETVSYIQGEWMICSHTPEDHLTPTHIMPLPAAPED